MISLIRGGGLSLSSGRREFLRIASLAGLGAVLPTARAREVPRSAGFGRAKSVIVVFANGGQSQLETWDPKPDAPAEIRGAFGSIQTPVPGVRLGEHMPRLAAIADRYTIVRGMCHDDLDHGSAVYQALTGRPHTQKSSNPLPSPSDFPTIGAVYDRIGTPSRAFETCIHLNGPALVPFDAGPGQDGGVLGRAHDPLVLGAPGDSGRSLLDVGADPPGRARLGLLGAVERTRADLASSRAGEAFDVWRRRALELIEAPAGLGAFDLSEEPDRVRERYGRNRSGQSCLLARRLVEAGVPWVTVFFNHTGRGQDNAPDTTDEYGWDTHNDIFESLQHRLLPRFDQGFSALIEDLDDRGLLDETLVVCMGEFGRAPRVALESTFAGRTPGRKHWASAYSIVMAGAGVGRGRVHGRSDRHAAYVEEGRVGPWDVAATIFSALGVDPSTEYLDALGRPLSATVGRPVEGLYGGE